MKVVFMGTPGFAVPSLEKMIEIFNSKLVELDIPAVHLHVGKKMKVPYNSMNAQDFRG